MFGIERNIVIALIVAVVIAVAISFGTNEFRHWWSNRQTQQSQQRVDAGTNAIIQEGNNAQQDRQVAEGGVSNARSAYNQQLEQAAQNDPAIRDRNTRAVPDKLRDLARERRIARERARRDALEGARRTGTEDAPER